MVNFIPSPDNIFNSNSNKNLRSHISYLYDFCLVNFYAGITLEILLKFFCILTIKDTFIIWWCYGWIIHII